MSISIFGDINLGGSYILGMSLSKDIEINIGHKSHTFIKGEYIYIGSARSDKGSSSLRYRTLRHSIRSNVNERHFIFKSLFSLFSADNDKICPKYKKLFWNIDYFLDNSFVNFNKIILIGDNKLDETDIIDIIDKIGDVLVVVKGFGANDHPGYTHLLKIPTDDWWIRLINKIEIRFNQ